MSKLEMLNSYLMERLAVTVREILEAVEAAVTDYRTETAQTRIENENLKQQLREVLTTLRGSRGNLEPIPGSIGHKAAQQEWGSSLEDQAELLEVNQTQVLNDGSVGKKRPRTLDLAPVCKNDPDPEEKTLNANLSAENPPSANTDENNLQEMLLPVVKLHRVKLEQEEKQIPVSLPDTDLPTDSGHSYSPESSQSMLSPSTGRLDNALIPEVTEKQELHNTAQPDQTTSMENNFTVARSLQLHLVKQHLIDKDSQSQQQVGFRNQT
ncbi:hypothetical protein AMELA_G00025760 [Ameiurus melas]|uniref:Uncharacterized protein n=1 Tax=Ameiurus melas TaxID=219545 RepID=A0A7J6BCP0_AMEME|nr:hypothetical protein AMELA_G00025760 [Ameiurus melas]